MSDGTTPAGSSPEERLRASEERFRTLIENTPEYIGTTTPDGKVVYINDAFKRIVPAQWEDTIKTPGLVPLTVFHPPEAAKLLTETAIPYAVKHGTWQGESTLLDAHGRGFPILQTVVAHLNTDGKLEFLSTICRDIEALRVGQEKIESSERRFRGLVENSSEGIMLISTDGMVLYESPPTQRICGRPAEQRIGTPAAEFIHPDDKPRFAVWFADLKEHPGIVSSIQVRNQRADGAWQWLDISGVDRLGEPSIGAVVANFRDITTQHAVDVRLRALMENSSDTVMILSPAGKRLYISPNVVHFTGRTIEETLAVDDLTEHVHPEDKEVVWALLRRVAATPNARERGEFRLQRKDGGWIWVESTAQNNIDVPGINGIVVNMRDITERKQAERVHAISEVKFRSFAEQAPMAIQLFRPDGLCTYANPAWQKLWQSDPAEAVMQYNVRQDPQANERGITNMIEQAFNGEAVDIPPFYYDPKLIGKTGRARWIHTHLYAIHGPDGSVNEVALIGEDVTQQQESREQVRRSEERFRVASQQTGQLIYDWDISRGTATWDGAVHELTGWSYDEFRTTTIPDGWAAFIHPDDRDAALKLLKEAQTAGKAYHTEYRFRRRDGSYILLEDTGSFMRDETGTVSRMVGAMKDITAIREAQRTRERQTEMFREVIDNALDAISIIGPDGSYRYQNRAALQMSGYDDNDPADTNAFQHVHPDDLDAARSTFTRALQSGQPAAITFRYQKKDGSWQWLETQGISMLTNPLVQGVLLFSRDITQQRLAQQQAQEAHERLNGIVNAMGDPVFVKDRKHRWVVLNDALCKLVGHTREELIGKSDYEFFPADQADVFWAKDEEVFRTGTENINEEQITEADGKVSIILTRKSIYTDPSGERFIVGVIRDVTMLQRAKEAEGRAAELEQLNRVMVGRELRMIELKEENRQLKEELAKVPGAPTQ